MCDFFALSVYYERINNVSPFYVILLVVMYRNLICHLRFMLSFLVYVRKCVIGRRI